MSYDKKVADHYLHGDLLRAIEATLPLLGKTTATVSIEDLAPVDEFHIGGRQATDHLIDQLGLFAQGHTLDVGCGLGGAARYVAHRYNNQVTGIDLTPEYIETGKVLSSWVKLDNQVTLEQGSALSMPFGDDHFDAAYMLHVGMNIEDKAALFTEIYRVLKSGASLGIYDVMRQNLGELRYPVPWAGEPSTSKLATPGQYQQVLSGAGFNTLHQNNRRDFALAFFKQLREKTQHNDGPPPLSLHTLLRESTGVKFKNMIDGMVKNLIYPVEIIACKPLNKNELLA